MKTLLWIVLGFTIAFMNGGCASTKPEEKPAEVEQMTERSLDKCDAAYCNVGKKPSLVTLKKTKPVLVNP
jgi:hypothetical protein